MLSLLSRMGGAIRVRRHNIVPFIMLVILAFILVVAGFASAAAPGDLDAQFGMNNTGALFTDIGTATADEAHAVYNLPGDSLLVGGISEDSFALAKYDANGDLDTSFNSTGKVTTDIILGDPDQINDIVVQNDGKIIAAGISHDGVNDAIVVVRYDGNGSLDNSFATNGVFFSKLGGTTATATAVALQTDGNIVVAGTLDGDFVALRLDPNGALDVNNFNAPSGFQTIDASGAANDDEGHGLIIQESSQKIVIGGFTDLGDHQDFAIARLHTDGDLDTTFGTNGISTADPSGGDNDLAYALGEQSNGGLVLAGFSEYSVTNTEDLSLVRFTADGALDATFGSSGTVILPVADTSELVYDLGVQQTDRLVVIGFTPTGGANAEDFRIQRFNSDGSVDTNFGTGGTLFTDIGPLLNDTGHRQDEAWAVAIQSDSKIAVAGLTDVNSGNMNFALTRYESQNDAPSLTNDTVNGVEDQTLTFAGTDYATNFNDQNGDALNQVKIVTLPANGVLKLNNADVTAGDEIPAADLANLTFVPAVNFNGDTSFNWNGSDGLSYAAANGTMTLTIAQVNDPPTFNLARTTSSADEDNGPQTEAGIALNMSVGAPYESDQQLSFVITTTNDSLFNGTPTVNAGTGTLSYTPADDAFGSANIFVRLQDNGGTLNGGNNSSSSQSIAITINSVNDAPSLTPGGDVTVAEDAGSQVVTDWATHISAGPPNESQGLQVQVNAVPNNLFAVAPFLNLATGDLTFAPVDDLHGSAEVSISLSDFDGTANGGVNTAEVYTFTLTIQSVNDAPSFVLDTASINHLEDAVAAPVTNKASGMSAGPANEITQTLSFSVTTNNNALFATLPEIDAATGELTYALAEDANGAAEVTAVLQDNGGTPNGGSDSSPAQSFTINVSPVNDPPAFFIAGDIFVDEEDFGSQTIPGYASGINTGAANESQSLTFNVNITEDSNNLLDGLPAIDPLTGNLTITTTMSPGQDRFATISVSLSDNGDSTNGGSHTSATQMFTVTMTFVNDAPTFTKGANQMVDEDAGATAVTGWAKDMDAGSPAETVSQQLNFDVSSDIQSLFAVQPAIDADTGDLTFTPADNAHGTTTITVILKDDGGTANNGADSSTPQTFNITINPVNDLPILITGTVTGTRNNVFTFAAADFSNQFTDVDGDSLQSVQILSLPGNGMLQLGDTAVTINQIIPAAQLATLRFVPEAEWFGFTSFSWNASDGESFAVQDAILTIQIAKGDYQTFIPFLSISN